MKGTTVKRTLLTILTLTVLILSITACGDGTEGRVAPRTYNEDKYQPNSGLTTTTVPFEGPFENNSNLTPDRDGILPVLIDRVPTLNGLSESDIRIRLLGTVCKTINDLDGNFMDVGEVIVESSASNFEFTYSDAGYIVAAAVALECPEWFDAAQEFANS